VALSKDEIDAIGEMLAAKLDPLATRTEMEVGFRDLSQRMAGVEQRMGGIEKAQNLTMQALIKLDGHVAPSTRDSRASNSASTASTNAWVVFRAT
jgi:hypothetical protein